MRRVYAGRCRLTVTESKSLGYLTAHPAGEQLPSTSNLNYAQGETLAKFAVIPIGADGKITIHNTSSGSVQVVVDVMGYIRG